jgi:hypothetical protein
MAQVLSRGPLSGRLPTTVGQPNRKLTATWIWSWDTRATAGGVSDTPGNTMARCEFQGAINALFLEPRACTFSEGFDVSSGFITPGRTSVEELFRSPANCLSDPKEGGLGKRCKTASRTQLGLSQHGTVPRRFFPVSRQHGYFVDRQMLLGPFARP